MHKYNYYNVSSSKRLHLTNSKCILPLKSKLTQSRLKGINPFHSAKNLKYHIQSFHPTSYL